MVFLTHTCFQLETIMKLNLEKKQYEPMKIVAHSNAQSLYPPKDLTDAVLPTHVHGDLEIQRDLRVRRH